MFRAIEAGLSRPAATSLSSEKACSLRAATGAHVTLTAYSFRVRTVTFRNTSHRHHRHRRASM